MRKLQRAVIANKCYLANHNTSNFKAEWERIHGKPKTVKKEYHHDDRKNWLKAWDRQKQAVKEFFANLGKKGDK